MEDSGDLPSKPIQKIDLPKPVHTRPIMHSSKRRDSEVRVSFRDREARRGMKLVDMNHDGMIYTDPDKRVAIGTSALSGCSALFVLSENPSNPDDRAAVMAHFDPMAV